MGKPNNILLTRIDNRLIHGQIVGNWAGTVGANLIVVCDDLVANSEVEQSVMRMAASTLGFDSRFFTVQKTIDVIANASSNQKILLVCRTPETLRKLIEGGVDIKKVNIGNLHFAPGKKQIGNKAYVSEQEEKDLDFIKKNVDEIFVQDTPDFKREEY